VQDPDAVYAGANTVTITAGTSWPTWTSGRRYLLNAGSNYTSMGNISLGGQHGVLIAKTGSGADPIVGVLQTDSRSKFSAVSNFEPRTRNLRVVGLDIAHFLESQRGYDYVAVISCLMRRYEWGTAPFNWAEGSEAVQTNHRYPRGLFLRGTEVRSGHTDGYSMFATLRGFHATDSRFDNYVAGASTYAITRVYGSYHTHRNCLWYSTHSGLNEGGGQGLQVAHSQLAIDGEVETEWRADDLVGPSSGNRYGYIGDKMFTQHSQYYAAGSALANGVVAIGGNPSGVNLVRPRLVGWEDCVWYPSGSISLTEPLANIGGQHVFWRNNKRDLGAGSAVSSNAVAPNVGVGDSVTFNGPYLRVDGANSRPVPTVF
jgi:hypothetical protein